MLPVGILIFIVVLYLRIRLIPSLSTDIAGIEQSMVYGIQTLMYNGKIYSSPMIPPFAITLYTPLFYFICAGIGKLFSVDPSTGIHQIYIIGRSLDLLFNLLTAFFVYKIAWRIFGIPKTSALSLFFISFVISFAHNFAVRPDALQDTFSVASIYYFLLHLSDSKSSAASKTLLFIAVLISALSVFAKQSGIQLIILFTSFTVLIRDGKSLIWIFIFSAIVYGSMLAVILLQYPFFFENTIGGLDNGICFENFLKFIITRYPFLWSILPMILISAFILMRKNSLMSGTLPDRFLSLAVTGTFLFATITALKNGSTMQYYTLFLNLAMVLIFKSLHRGIAESQHIFDIDIRKWSGIFYGYCCLAMFAFSVYNYKLVYTFNKWPVLIDLRGDGSRVAALLKQELAKENDKYVFAHLNTDVTVHSRQGINNILFKESVLPQLEILSISERPLKIIGYNRFEEDLQNGRIEYIIESAPAMRFIPSQNYTAIMSTHFRLWKEMKGYQIYRYFQ